MATRAPPIGSADHLRRIIATHFSCGAWGVPNELSAAESDLRQQCVAVQSSLERLAAYAEATLQVVEAQRQALLSAINMRFDQIASEVRSSRSRKAAALEAELVELDRALECTQSIRTSLARLPDEYAAIDDADLAERIHAFDSELAELPISPVEADAICVAGLGTAATATVPRLLREIQSLGRVVEGRTPTPRDVIPKGLPLHAKPASTITFSLTYSEEFVLRHSVSADTSAIFDRVQSLRNVVSITPGLHPRVSARVCLATEKTVELCFAPGRTLPVIIADSATAPDNRRVSVSIGPLPADLPLGAFVLLNCQIAGRPVDGFPLRLSIIKSTGLQPPVSIGGRFASPGIVITPAVSAAGVVWIPTGEAASVEECAGSPFPVAAFEADGKVVSLPEEGREQFCLSRYSRIAAFDDKAEMLYVGDANGRSSVVAAFDATLCRRWVSRPLTFNVCGGIAALSSLGLVAVSSSCGNRVFVLRASDGHCCAYFSCKVPGYLASWTDDDETTVFVSCQNKTASAYQVLAFRVARCHSSAEQAVALAGQILVKSVPDAPRARLLAVMPPSTSTADSHAHLIVGTLGSPVLHMLALPSLALVYEYRLEGMELTGLAADPWGTSLVVCNGTSRLVEVISWPPPAILPPPAATLA